MSEFQSDIKDKQYDEDGDELDKHVFKLKKYPDGLGSVRKAVENAEQLCGLDRNVMANLLLIFLKAYLILPSLYSSLLSR